MSKDILERHFSASEIVEDIVPICVGREKVVKIVGDEPDITLTLIPTEKMQPCIGYETSTGLSYGRFEMSSGILEKIILDNIKVVCMPDKFNKNFALGTYGMEYVPSIELLNGASIECPEVTGKRMMRDCITRYDGSTKLTGYADYFIVKDNQNLDDFFTEEQKLYIRTMRDFTNTYTDFDPTWPIDGLKALMHMTKLKVVDDYKEWKTNNPTMLMTLRSCVLLGMPSEMASPIEFKFENKKLSFLINKNVFGESCGEMSPNIATAILMRDTLVKNNYSCISYEICYEMIPSYCWEFIKGIFHENQVRKYLSVYSKDTCIDSSEFSCVLDESIKDNVMKCNI